MTFRYINADTKGAGHPVVNGEVVRGEVVRGDVVRGEVVTGEVVSRYVVRGEVVSGEVESGDVDSAPEVIGSEFSQVPKEITPQLPSLSKT